MGEYLSSSTSLKEKAFRTARVAALTLALASCGRDSTPTTILHPTQISLPENTPTPVIPLADCGEDPVTHYKYLRELLKNPAACEGDEIVTFGYVYPQRPYSQETSISSYGKEKRPYILDLFDGSTGPFIETHYVNDVYPGSPSLFPLPPKDQSITQVRVQGVIENITPNESDPTWRIYASSVEPLIK